MSILSAPGHPASARPRFDVHSAAAQTILGELMMLTVYENRIPRGPPDAFDTKMDLRMWIENNFRLYGDIFSAIILGTNVYVVSSPDYAQHVLRRNWTNYRKGLAVKRIAMLLGNGLMVSEGEFWVSQRRMIQPAFHRNVIASLYDVMKSANSKLLEKWEKAAQQKETINVTSDVSLTVLEITLRSLFGSDYSLAAPYFNILHDNPARDLGFAQTFADLRQFLAGLIERRRRNTRGGADILGMLMEARDQRGRQMPDGQLVNEITTIIVAGHETTASTLNLLWYLVSQNPEVERLLTAEIESLISESFPEMENLTKYEYTRLVIDEALRLYPPGWLLTRKAKKDDRLGEYFVPAGTEIYISPYIIQRHPELWTEPNSFKPDRFYTTDAREKRSAALLPFSIGPRNCIGELFARTEMQVHLIMVANRVRLRWLNQELPEFEAGVNLRAKHDFVMLPELKA
jgi:cytochrome P450